MDGASAFALCALLALPSWLHPAAAHAATAAVGLARLDTLPLLAPEFLQPVAIAAGSFGRLYVADLGRGSVMRIDASGRVLFEFEPPRHQPGMQPLDLEITGFKVFVLDAQSNALLRYSDRGSFLDVLQSFRDEGSETPRALSVDPTGRVLLANTARNQVRMVDEGQRHETTVGGFGSRPGEMARPSGVAFATDGSFYVADTGNARLQRFSGVGNFVMALHDSLTEPRGLAIGGQGELFVADPRRRAVQLFAPSGAWRAELRLPGYQPTDVTVVGDTLWVLSAAPPALLRVRVLRGE